MGKNEVLIDGLSFSEGPRWREGHLWFSDMHLGQVVKVDLAGKSEVVAEVPNSPSGLGWLPDGRLLVVSMNDRRVLRLDSDGLHEHADLSNLASWHCNDMVVDSKGRAYVGNFGWDIFTSQTPVATNLVLVTPEGDTSIAAEDLVFPNGTVITPDGRTMVIGETFAARLTAFDIGDDGGLTNRREWARLEGAAPDGICLDAEGAIWVASPVSSEVLRVLEGGEVTERISVEEQAFACMLGGPEGKHLFICTAPGSEPEECRAAKAGRIEVVEVGVPGAGLP